MTNIPQIEELEKLIGKSCDLIDSLTGKIGVYEVYIIGIKIITGFDRGQLIFPGRRHYRSEFIVYVDSIVDGGNDTGCSSRCTWRVKDITNIRTKRTMKGPVHPETIALVMEKQGIVEEEKHD